MARPGIKPGFSILILLHPSIGIWFDALFLLKNWNKLRHDLATEGDLATDGDPQKDSKSKIYLQVIL